jgi:hypothetical protein
LQTFGNLSTCCSGTLRSTCCVVGSKAWDDDVHTMRDPKRPMRRFCSVKPCLASIATRLWVHCVAYLRLCADTVSRAAFPPPSGQACRTRACCSSICHGPTRLPRTLLMAETNYGIFGRRLADGSCARCGKSGQIWGFTTLQHTTHSCHEFADPSTRL